MAQGSKAKPVKARVGRPRGSFEDFDLLLEQLGSPLLIELGKPVPEDRRVPRPRAGDCPVAHNRALFGEDLH
jgi:hypothetical protein